MISGKILGTDFFKRDTVEVAKNLLGKKIIRNISGNFFCAKIVETEAYLSLIHISEPTRQCCTSRMPSSA